MIGKAEWFERRKYGGWGLHPKDWRGWMYIIAFIIPLFVFHSLPYFDTKTRIIVTIVWALVLAVDTIDIMIKIKKDERERVHEAIAERNSVWAITIILAVGLAYQVGVSAFKQEILVDWWIVAALIIGLVVKSSTNYYLDRKD